MTKQKLSESWLIELESDLDVCFLKRTYTPYMLEFEYLFIKYIFIAICINKIKIVVNVIV